MHLASRLAQRLCKMDICIHKLVIFYAAMFVMHGLYGRSLLSYKIWATRLKFEKLICHFN